MRRCPPSAISTGLTGLLSYRSCSRSFNVKAQPAPISLASKLVTGLNDPMPQPEYQALRILPLDYNESLADRSYATGARLLLKRDDARKGKFPPRGQAQ